MRIPVSVPVTALPLPGVGHRHAEVVLYGSWDPGCLGTHRGSSAPWLLVLYVREGSRYGVAGLPDPSPPNPNDVTPQGVRFRGLDRCVARALSDECSDITRHSGQTSLRSLQESGL